MGGSRDTPEQTGRAATNLKKEQVLFDEAKVISSKIEPNLRNNAVAPFRADNGNIYNSENVGIVDDVDN